MTEWEVVGVIIALTTLIAIFVKVAVDYSRVTTKLDTTLNNLQKTLDEFRTDNKNDHEKMIRDIDEHERALHNHDIRITKLEEKEND